MVGIEKSGNEEYFVPNDQSADISQSVPDSQAPSKEITEVSKKTLSHQESNAKPKKMRAHQSESSLLGEDFGGSEPITKVKSKSPVTPQIYVGFDENHNPKISIGREAPPFKNLVLSGGGAKGLVYPAFLKEFDKGVGLLESLEEVAGSSAGALMAFLISTGISLEEIEEFSSNTSMLDELKGNALTSINKKIVLGKGVLPALKLRDTLVKFTARPVHAYFMQNIINSPEVLEKIKNMRGGEEFLKRAEEGFGKGLTFNDLKILHTLEPQKFKLLNVTSFDVENRKTLYFNAENTPNINCFEAVVASMSLPLVIKSVKIDLKDGRGVRNLMDGGVGTNVPLEIFSERQDYNPAGTLVLHFENKGFAYNNLHTSLFSNKKGVVYKIINFAFRHFGKLLRLENSLLKDAKKVHNLGFNAFVVPHGDIRTTDFKVPINSVKVQKALEQAKKVAGMYVELSGRGQLIQEEYQDMQQAINSLSSEELEALNLIAEKKIALAQSKIETGKEKATMVEKLNVEIIFYLNIIAEYQKRLQIAPE